MLASSALYLYKLPIVSFSLVVIYIKKNHPSYIIYIVTKKTDLLLLFHLHRVMCPWLLVLEGKNGEKKLKKMNL